MKSVKKSRTVGDERDISLSEQTTAKDKSKILEIIDDSYPAISIPIIVSTCALALGLNGKTDDLTSLTKHSRKASLQAVWDHISAGRSVRIGR